MILWWSMMTLMTFDLDLCLSISWFSRCHVCVSTGIAVYYTVYLFLIPRSSKCLLQSHCNPLLYFQYICIPQMVSLFQNPKHDNELKVNPQSWYLTTYIQRISLNHINHNHQLQQWFSTTILMMIHWITKTTIMYFYDYIE